MIETNIDEPWDWAELSNNRNMTIEFIDRHADKPWNWSILSCREYIMHNEREKQIQLLNKKILE